MKGPNKISTYGINPNGYNFYTDTTGTIHYNAAIAMDWAFMFRPANVTVASITAGATGGTIYCTDALTENTSAGGLCVYDGTTWRMQGSGIAATTNPSTWILNAFSVGFRCDTPSVISTRADVFSVFAGGIVDGV